MKPDIITRDVKTIKLFILSKDIHGNSRSQWLRGLRRGSAAASLLELWVRTPWGYECLPVESVQVSAMGRLIIQRIPTECVCVCVCV